MMYSESNRPKGPNRREPMGSTRGAYCDGARKVQAMYCEEGGRDDIIDKRIKDQKTDIWTVLSWIFCIFGIGGLILGVLANSTAVIIVCAIIALLAGVPCLARKIWFSFQ